MKQTIAYARAHGQSDRRAETVQTLDDPIQRSNLKSEISKNKDLEAKIIKLQDDLFAET